ncbi:MAG: DNA alkylation repair protein [Ruminococcaceae bacterium]|nr:DNA alkylation repair protein [Oscillospiraceae bacterium]
MTEIQAHLFAMQDEGYRTFQCRLMPTVDAETVIGVRTPQLRKYAKTIANSSVTKPFLQALPHRYYEENNLHAFLIEEIKEFDTCVEALNTFLPYVDNWATCDSMNPKILGKHKPELLAVIENWLSSPDTYTVRFGIKLLMTWFLDADFLPEYLQKVAAVNFEEYYIKMMISWYFATALAKQYKATLPYLKEHRLSPWIHAKTIQKATESYRLTKEQKLYLKTL